MKANYYKAQDLILEAIDETIACHQECGETVNECGTVWCYLGIDTRDIEDVADLWADFEDDASRIATYNYVRELLERFARDGKGMTIKAEELENWPR